MRKNKSKAGVSVVVLVVGLVLWMGNRCDGGMGNDGDRGDEGKREMVSVVEKAGGDGVGKDGGGRNDEGGGEVWVSVDIEDCMGRMEMAVSKRGTVEQLIAHAGYVTSWNGEWLEPNWVAYDLTKKEVEGTEERPSREFEPDPLVTGKSAEHRDYTRSGYDRGHMAPAADMKWSEQAMAESFYLSNVCPQDGGLNSGVWKRLEERCRALAEDGTVYICCGPMVEKRHKSIGENGVAVPAKFFKVMCMKRNGRWQAIGFVFPNGKCKGSMFDYAMSVDEVERITGHDFFHNLPDDTENAIEGSWKMKEWQ